MLFIILKEQAVFYQLVMWLKPQKIICHSFKHMTLFSFFTFVINLFYILDMHISPLPYIMFNCCVFI